MKTYTNVQIDKYCEGLKLTYKKLSTQGERCHQDWQVTREGFEDDTDISNCISLGKEPVQVLKVLEWLTVMVREINDSLHSEKN